MTFSKIPRVAAGVTVAGVAAVTIGVGAFAAGGGRLQLTAANRPVATTEQGKAADYCNRFLSHLAGNLGKTQSEVITAVGKAVAQTIDEAVSAGDLTKAQADRLKARLASGPVCSGRFASSFRFRAKAPHELGAVLDAAATSLGLTTAELKADMAAGETLHQMADSRGISEAQFRAALIKNLTPLLDRAVSRGKLTETQEAEILQHLQTGPIPFWDAALNRHQVPSRTTPESSPAA